MAQEKKFLEDFLPFLAIKDGCVLSKRGDVTFGWRVWLPIAFSVNEPGYDSIVETFAKAYRILPEWCVIHKQDVFRYDRYKAKSDPFFLTEAYYRHHEGREYLNGHSFLYVTFSTKAVIERKTAESGFFGILDTKVPKPAELRKYAELASQFEAILSGNPLLALEPLASEDFLRRGEDGRDEGVIPDYLRLYSNDGPDYNISFHDDRIDVGGQEARVWYVEDGDAMPATVASVKFVNEMSSGATKVFLSGGSPIGYSLRIPHVVNRYLVTVPKGTVEKELDARKRVNTSFSQINAEAAVNASELSGYLADVAENGTVSVKSFMNLMAWAPKERMPEVRNAVVRAFRSDMDVQVVEEDMTAPLHFYAGIPSAGAEIGYDSCLNSELVSFLCQGLWDGHDTGMNGGVVRVSDRRRMVPMTIDIQSLARARGQINNMNALVVGPSGSGKSFTMNSLVQNFYEAGQHIMIIDVGDSYEGLCAVIREYSGGKDGVYNTYDPEHPFGFNPFKGRQHWGEVDEDGEATSSGMDFLLSLLKTIYNPEGGWTNEASSVLKYVIELFFNWWDNGVPESVEEDLRDAYLNERRRRAKRNHRTFDEEREALAFKNPLPRIFKEGRRGKDPLFNDFYLFISTVVSPLLQDENFRMGEIVLPAGILDMTRFATAMDMYKAGGIYGFLLNAEEEADLFSSRFTVFEVDKIKDNNDLFPLWVLCIMHSFEEKMRNLPCQKVMVIEEAWKAISTPTMANFIVWMWRTARKFRTSAIVVTQDISDLTGSDIVKGAIIQNSDVRILLDQRKNANNFQEAVKVLGLSQMATNLVLSVNTDLLPEYGTYKEAFFAIGEQYCNVFAIEVSREQAICFETDKTMKQPLFDLAKERGSFIQAIKEMAEKKAS